MWRRSDWNSAGDVCVIGRSMNIRSAWVGLGLHLKCYRIFWCLSRPLAQVETENLKSEKKKDSTQKAETSELQTKNALRSWWYRALEPLCC